MRRLIDIVLALALIGGLALIAAWLQRHTAPVLRGTAVAIDGDTLAFGPDRVRLKGLDAPELDQSCERAGRAVACGKAAREALRVMILPGLSCQALGHDVYGRILATCMTAAGDIGERLVEAGLAVDEGCCLAAEARARAAHRGIWAGAFERPSDWRKNRANVARP